jgi:hypothetical protein
MKNDPWNRCDVCGKFIAMDDFDKGAVRYCVTPDSEFSRETWETLCVKHGIAEQALTGRLGDK